MPDENGRVRKVFRSAGEDRAVNQVADIGRFDAAGYQERAPHLLPRVLAAARAWGASYAWVAHEKPAIKAGLAPEIIEALRQQRKPEFKNGDERVIYDALTELLETRSLSQPGYDRLIKEFGVDLTIEIVSVAGFYGMIATVLKGFDVPTPNGEKPF